MTNFEYWKDEILDIARSSGSFALFNEKPAKCRDTECSQCGFVPKERETCIGNILKWLYAEHIDRLKLTKKERAFCELVETGWLARDESGVLYFYCTEPHKESIEWEYGSRLMFVNVDILSVNFPFIKWEDEKAWSIEDLLKLEVEE